MNHARPIRQDLRHWMLHVPMSAGTSFVIAYRTDWHTAQAIAGMIGGITIFIVLYASIWNSRWFNSRAPVGGLVNRALLYGTWTRSVLGFVGLCELLLDRADKSIFSLLTILDFWAGFLSTAVVQSVGRSRFVHALRVTIGGPDPARRAHNMLVGDVNSLLPTSLVTCVEGVILSLVLLIFSGCWLIIFRYRAHRKLVAQQAAAASPL